MYARVRRRIWMWRHLGSRACHLISTIFTVQSFLRRLFVCANKADTVDEMPRDIRLELVV